MQFSSVNKKHPLHLSTAYTQIKQFIYCMRMYMYLKMRKPSTHWEQIFEQSGYPDYQHFCFDGDWNSFLLAIVFSSFPGSMVGVLLFLLGEGLVGE